jgi:D-alanyl-D-alanine dipeptidase
MKKPPPVVNKALCALFLFSLTINNTKANPYGLTEIKAKEGLIIKLEYKTNKNITGKPLYPRNAKAYLHPIAAKKLDKAIELLRPLGYGIVILDAWRPYIAGAKLWNKAVELDLRDYYCPPDDGGHTRAVALDITLYKLHSPNTKVPMPSEFDEPSPKYEPESELKLYVSPDTIVGFENAKLLKNVMNKAGFVGHSKEWWHFNLPNLKDFPLIEKSTKRKLPKMNF